MTVRPGDRPEPELPDNGAPAVDGREVLTSVAKSVLANWSTTARFMVITIVLLGLLIVAIIWGVNVEVGPVRITGR